MSKTGSGSSPPWAKPAAKPVEPLAGVFEAPAATLALAAGLPVRAARKQGRRQLERALEARRAGEAGADYKKVRRGWCLGTETFRKELLGQMKERLRAETTVTVRWIAERLHMGAPGYVHHLLYLERNAKGK